MKKILPYLALLCALAAGAQDKVVFEYDDAGNQIKRELEFCSDCNRREQSPVTPKSKPADQDLSKFFPGDEISYYPNPVKEELYLKWELINDNSVSSIEVYSLTGQLLQRYTDLKNSSTKNISFLEYPQGTYNLLMSYANGERKSIKIIKK